MLGETKYIVPIAQKMGRACLSCPPMKLGLWTRKNNQCQFQVFFVTNIFELHAKTWNLHLCTFSAHTIPSTKQRIKIRIWNLHGGAIYFRFFSSWENKDICTEV